MALELETGGVTARESSYAHCRQVTRKRARNFFYAFRLLDAERRDAICAIYAFMRRCDDLSDEAGATVEALEQWRGELNRALEGAWGADPIWPAFHDTVTRYGIPVELFQEMIDGVSSDLRRSRMEDFEELYRYCYQVASVAGLSLMYVMQATSKEALALAEKCGVAFQLTNILRDVKEDFERGRVYLPRQDMERFQVEEIRETDAFLELLRFEAERAGGYYQEARALPEMVDRSCAGALWALMEIYQRLLERIERCGYRVLSERVRVPAAEKLWILARAQWRWRWSS